MKNDLSVYYRYLTVSDLDILLDLERIVFDSLPDSSILRSNTRSMWRSCLVGPHKTLAAFSNQRLIGVSVLYFPNFGDDDDLSQFLVSVPSLSQGLYGPLTANHKICFVHPDYRGLGLQKFLSFRLEQYARDLGVRLLCATVSPKNIYSRNNALAMGMVYDSTIVKYGSERDLFYKLL